ncbi:hypothetical protein [Rhodobacter sp. SY28-1]|uniref:hypothetical protein n=1 Tax=Rhodobacter sp. SY28-1 TaxID=2562317 RepID=UPI0010C08075|nr:hypothetical protein [Rhodobacter sp. SY28-1]
MAELLNAFYTVADERLWSGELERGTTDAPEPRFQIDTGPPHDECKAFANWLMGRFLDQYANEIRVASPSGSVLHIAPSLLMVETDDPFDYNDYRQFPESRDGRLRAGSVRTVWIDFEGMKITENLAGTFDQVFRPIVNFPLCISLSAIPMQAEALVDKVLERASIEAEEAIAFKSGSEFKDIVLQMVEAWDRGEITNKAIGRMRFGRGRKTAEWLALWRELGIARPAASTPGRKSKGGNR